MTDLISLAIIAFGFLVLLACLFWVAVIVMGLLLIMGRSFVGLFHRERAK